uniref:Uncharacterized protein n=1 Tax=uncultured prokaryote TaxID=198431 RepID=A0A0H5QH22_9ZZZZ|nr:hypothetical protein [uncultured prokaryote]
MAFQSVPNCAEAVIRGVVNTIPVVNVLNFTKVGGSYNQTDIDALAAVIDAWFADSIMGHTSNQVQYVETVVRGLENLNDYEAQNNDETTFGAVTAAPMPGQVTWVVKHLSGLTGRSARGRTYIWGIPVTSLQADENLISLAAAEDFVEGFDELPPLVAAAGWAHVIVSRFTGNAPRPTGIFFPVVSYAYTDLRLDTQRRRLS